MDSLSVDPTKSENEAVKGWALCLLQVEPTSCHIFTNKERNSNFPSPQTCQRQQLFHFKLLQHLQLILTLHFTGNHGFWYSTCSSYLSTRTRGSQPSSSSLSKLLQHYQLTMTLYLTGNHGFWYCSRSKLLNNNSKTIGKGQDTWEMKKYDKKPMTHVHFNSKRTQGVAPRPRPVRVLLSLCGSDLRSVVLWRGSKS